MVKKVTKNYHVIPNHNLTQEEHLLEKFASFLITLSLLLLGSFGHTATLADVYELALTNDPQLKIDEATFLDVFDGVPNFSMNNNDLINFKTIVDVLDHTNFFNSKSEIIRLLNQNSISLNKTKIDSSFKLSELNFINNKYILVQKGKKNYYLISVS